MIRSRLNLFKFDPLNYPDKHITITLLVRGNKAVLFYAKNAGKNVSDRVIKSTLDEFLVSEYEKTIHTPIPCYEAENFDGSMIVKADDLINTGIIIEKEKEILAHFAGEYFNSFGIALRMLDSYYEVDKNYKDSSDKYFMGFAIYRYYYNPDNLEQFHYAYSRAVKYSALLNMKYVADDGQKPIQAYVFPEAIGKKITEEELQQALVHPNRPLYYKTSNSGEYNILKLEAESSSTTTPSLTTTLDYSNYEQKMFIATIFAETSVCSNTAGVAVANVIMNRVNNKTYSSWASYNTAQEIIENTGFDAYSQKTGNYQDAMSYLNGTYYNKILSEYVDKLIEICMPVYWGEVDDITNGAVFYYSPKKQAELHKIYPQIYPEIPSFMDEPLEEVKIPGTENDDLRFYKFK